MEKYKKYLPIVGFFIITFTLGAFIGIKFFAPALTTNHTTTIEKQPTIIQGQTKTVTDTQIAYLPKETVIYKYIDKVIGKEETLSKLENTDLQAIIGKTNFNVVLNGKPITFTKADEEKYMFDKNKIALNQTSMISFNATVSPMIIDQTKRWSIGIGYGKNQLGGKLDFPINNSNSFGGWVYGDKEVKTAGVQIKF